MTVGSWNRPNYLTQTGTAYPLAIDGDLAVAERVVASFSPAPAVPAAMTVTLAAGALFVAGTLVEVAAQSVSIGAAPASNSRIDRIVVDETTGVASVIVGTVAASPTAPAITSGKYPVARVTVAAGTTAIAATMIDDERVPFVGQASIRSNSLTPSRLALGSWTTLASAATVNLGGQNSRNIVISGSVAITSFGTSGPADNVPYLLRFTGTPLLTAGANLILPGGANITAAAGDVMMVVHDTTSVWRVVFYGSAGVSPVGLQQTDWNTGTGVVEAPISPAKLDAKIANAFSILAAGLGAAVPAGSTLITTTGIYNPSAGTKFIMAIMGGGGGAGGGGGSVVAGGGGGGAGGVSLVILKVTPGTDYTVTIGPGGAGVNNQNGNAGGDTSITVDGVTYIAGGGSGGVKAGNGSGTPGSGGAGGTVTNGLLSFNGNSGTSTVGSVAGVGGKQSWPSSDFAGYGVGGAGWLGSSGTGYSGVAGFCKIIEFK